MKLWGHEVLRVFSDRLNSEEDRDQFLASLNEQLETIFQANYEEHCTTGGEPALFVDFLSENARGKPVYEEVTDLGALRTLLNDKLA